MTFTYQIETDVDKVNFQEVAEVLYSTGLAKETDVPNTEKAFRNSDITIFIKDGDRVIGVGRALTDFVSQSASRILAMALRKA